MANTNAKVLGRVALIGLAGLGLQRGVEQHYDRKAFLADMKRCYTISLEQAPIDTVKIPSGRGLEAVLNKLGVDINTQFGECVSDVVIKKTQQRGNYTGKHFVGDAIVPSPKYVKELKAQFTSAMELYEKNHSLFYSTN